MGWHPELPKTPVSPEDRDEMPEPSSPREAEAREALADVVQAPVWSNQEMVDLLNAMALSADRHTLSFTEAANIARSAADVIRWISHEMAPYALPPATPPSDAQFDLSNHHNALKCPYCNPKGLTFAPPSDERARVVEALKAAAEWCEIEGAKIGAVDGYDYRSGEEYGLRRAQIELRKRALSPTNAPAAEGGR